jgi:hypothetical protein
LGKFGFKIDKILKKSSPENERSTKCCIKLEGRIPLLLYHVKHIHGQFQTYLKLPKIHFKQIAKTIPTSCTVGKNLAVILIKIHFIFYPIDFPICTILFLLLYHVSIAVWCPAAALSFRNLKSVIKTLFGTI